MTGVGNGRGKVELLGSKFSYCCHNVFKLKTFNSLPIKYVIKLHVIVKMGEIKGLI